ncbi:MAG: hypothetical protein Q3988_04720 [Gemella sp.]|nr:hypothetical protein [Gemella sp.]
MKDNRILALISAHNPENDLIDFIRDLSLNDIDALVVNDGSDSEYEELFTKIESEGNEVLRHAKKMGSGRALKTAINHMLNQDNLPPYTGIVVTTADAITGIESVLRLEKEIITHPNNILLARQNVNYDNVRLQDKLFNRFTSFTTSWIYGKRIVDNFTKLRAYPMNIIDQILETQGEGVDLEARFLAKAMGEGIQVREVRIDNNYHTEKTGTEHILEKMKVLKELANPFIKYLSASLVTALAELTLFKIFTTLFAFFNLEKGLGFIFTSVLLAKLATTLLNIVLNRNYKYKGSGRKKVTFYKHSIINFIKAALSSYLIIEVMNRFGYDEISSKILVDIVLFLLFYKIVYHWVFSKPNKENKGKKLWLRKKK